MKLKSIETTYNGYRFRSRLEARWAVFFDEMNFKWEYEPEGYELGDDRYLPDFRLPEHRLWVEIKPGKIPDLARAIHDGRSALQRARKLADASGWNVIICYGSPGLRDDGIRVYVKDAVPRKYLLCDSRTSFQC